MIQINELQENSLLIELSPTETAAIAGGGPLGQLLGGLVGVVGGVAAGVSAGSTLGDGIQDAL